LRGKKTPEGKKEKITIFLVRKKTGTHPHALWQPRDLIDGAAEQAVSTEKKKNRDEEKSRNAKTRGEARGAGVGSSSRANGPKGKILPGRDRRKKMVRSKNFGKPYKFTAPAGDLEMENRRETVHLKKARPGGFGTRNLDSRQEKGFHYGGEGLGGGKDVTQPGKNLIE